MGRQLLVCLLLCCTWVGVLTEHRPPSIYLQPSRDVYFKTWERVDLPCEAVAVPNATYTWKRNGIDFSTSDVSDRLIQLPGVGSIAFYKPEEKDEGFYQCFATNEYGVSASIMVNLQAAILRDFYVRYPTTTYRPTLGASLTLPCVPPISVPAPLVYWAVRDKSGAFIPLDYDARVTVDHESRLRFTNVRAEDHQNGNSYICLSRNDMVRRTSRGLPNLIITQGETEQQRPVTYMWASPSDNYGLQGQLFKMKCIFAGNPTPDVHWERADNKPFPNHTRFESFGQELVFDPLEFSDQGDYQCLAVNSLTSQPVRRNISLHVESRPYWIEEPKDLTLGIGGDASFKCLAGGAPEPYVQWYINTELLYYVYDHPYKRVSPTEIVFLNVKHDMVVQCNATNKHGYIWGDVYLRVDSNPSTPKVDQSLIG